MLVRDTSFVVVDVETTGLSSTRHRITEIGLVRVEGGKIVESYQQLLNPEQFIPAFITHHTGISNAMVYGQPRFEDALPGIQQFLSKQDAFVLTGHNVKFDYGFLVESFTRANQELTLSDAAGAQHLLCTCRLARRLLPQLRSKSLESVQAYFGIRNAKQHRALEDAEATAKVLSRFIDLAAELDIHSLQDFLRLQFVRPNYGRRQTKRHLSLREKVRAFPERPGVYTMMNASGEVLYVGKAKNLRDRVSSYFSRANTEGTKLTQLMRLAKDITFEETGSELSALLLESKKIKEFRPRFNSMERWYKPQSFVRLSLNEAFPTLSFAREPAEDGGEYYGPFKSREATEALIEILNRAFKLRECGDKFRIGADVKPCIYYEIKRCDAPCALLQSEGDYRLEVKRLQEFLAAGHEGILAMVEKMMMAAAERLDFEEAQFLKFRLIELQRVLGSGERPSASVSASDYVILNPTANGECEVLFVRYGRLIKQKILGVLNLDIARSWLERQLRMYFGPTAAIPPECGKPEIDEMRILSRWVEESRRKGSTIVYLNERQEESVEQIVKELRRILVPIHIVTEPTVSEVLKDSTKKTSTKRLTLKPMKR